MNKIERNQERIEIPNWVKMIFYRNVQRKRLYQIP